MLLFVSCPWADSAQPCRLGEVTLRLPSQEPHSLKINPGQRGLLGCGAAGFFLSWTSFSIHLSPCYFTHFMIFTERCVGGSYAGH